MRSPPPGALNWQLEAVFTTLALGVLLPHAWGSPKRVQLFLSALVFGVLMETLGCFVTESHAHSTFYVQLTPYLPLKEDLWYAILLYPSCLLAAEAFPHSALKRAVVVGTLAILHDAPYEFTNARPGVGLVAINKESFAFGDMREDVFGGSALVVLSFILCSFAFGLVATSLDAHPFVVALVSAAVACAVQSPFQALKYLGCTSLLPDMLVRDGFLAFHKRCLTVESTVSSAACTVVLAALFALIMVWRPASPAASKREPVSKPPLLVNALGCHIFFIYLLVRACFRAEPPRGEKMASRAHRLCSFGTGGAWICQRCLFACRWPRRKSGLFSRCNASSHAKRHSSLHSH